MIRRYVAIQGYHGSFHEQAALDFYKKAGPEYTELQDNIEIVECATFEDIFTALADGCANAAVIAVENTISGGLLPNLDLLRQYNVTVNGEVYLQIHQNLMALPGQHVEEIKEVRTHYMAINQTRKYFEENCPWIRIVESEDTAGSAAEIAGKNLAGVGAVASSLAAEAYGLEIIAGNIETFKRNYTRFLVIDNSLSIPDCKRNKASWCFTLPHTPGSLARVLTILSFYDMNLTRIQSLPIPGKEWQYFFYADLLFENYSRYEQALAAVRPLLEELDIIGEYMAGFRVENMIHL